MFTKPNKQKAIDGAVVVSGGIAGAAASDGVVGLVPEEYKKWGKPAFALACAIAAALKTTKTTGGKFTQGALMGMSIKQGLDSLREMVFSKMDKQDAETTLGKFTNNVLGLAGTDVIVPEVTMDAEIFRRNRQAQAQAAQSASHLASTVDNNSHLA